MGNYFFLEMYIINTSVAARSIFQMRLRSTISEISHYFVQTQQEDFVVCRRSTWRIPPRVVRVDVARGQYPALVACRKFAQKLAVQVLPQRAVRPSYVGIY